MSPFPCIRGSSPSCGQHPNHSAPLMARKERRGVPGKGTVPSPIGSRRGTLGLVLKPHTWAVKGD